MDSNDARIAAATAAIRRIAGGGAADVRRDAVGAGAIDDLERAVGELTEVIAPASARRRRPPATPARPGVDPELELELFRTTIERAADGVFWLNADGGFDYVNEQACQMLGYSRAELMALRLWDIDPGMSPERYPTHWASYRSPGAATRRFEMAHRHKDGTVFPIEVSSRHIRVGDYEFHLAFTRDISDRKRANDALRLTQFCIDRASIAIFRIDRAGALVSVNDEACRSLGYTREELLQLSVFDVAPGRPRASWDGFLALARARGGVTFASTHRRKDGTTFPIELTVSFIDAAGVEYVFAFARETTLERKAQEERDLLQAQLIQAQKMESIGRLAGGIAHDFNNMLAVILGYTELLQRQLVPGDPIREDIAQIETAAAHSRDITRQLLAFSRKQIAVPRPMDLNALVGSLQRTLARLIGERITLRLEPGDDLWTVEIDPSQVDQILVNLVVNARDAMPDGGQLTLETGNVHIDEDYCRHHAESRPGDYVRVQVSDDGHGMDQTVLAHVFEPFFTTKGVGEGTGLGLATVYGIVKQNNGFINVYSEPGRGTTFRIYLPRWVSGGEVEGAPEEVRPVRGDATILLVEDEALVRQMTWQMLTQLGYQVQAVASPAEALAVCEAGAEPMDLLLTDVVLPAMNGPELRDRVGAHWPGTRALFMSGYTSNVIVHHGVLDRGVHFIQKPFTLLDLSRAVQRALGSA
ncbi:MAG: hypothetical protein CVU56_13590 [Deltaproteobacteria bacterium HGW-Deltaproteobacteria-14]|jgi:PAS domain S-box-containing protein|nr:MAG: hypothetical protein CVU56_13590 [Deltaproteobacteria bacterium HGW-Deltaproteobacteria-14]